MGESRRNVSKGSTETQTVLPPRTTSLGRAKAYSQSAQSTPRPAQEAGSHQNFSRHTRAASYTYVRDVHGLGITATGAFSTPLGTSAANLKAPLHRIVTLPAAEKTAWPLPEDIDPDLQLRLDQAQNLLANLHTSPNTASGAGEAGHDDGQSSVASSLRNYRTSIDSYDTVSTIPTTPGPRVSITSNFSRSLSFKSPLGSAPTTPSHSRSPSPPLTRPSSSHPDSRGAGITQADGAMHSKRSFRRRKDSTKRSRSGTIESERSQSSDDQSTRKSRPKAGILRRKSSRSSNTAIATSDGERDASDAPRSGAPAVPPLPTSFSSDRLSSLRSSAHPSTRATPVPRLLYSDPSHGSPSLLPKKKDELWSVFRALDADFAKFSSKSIAFKASVVRSSLIPFLRSYAIHPSNRALRPEDLDRRANILNKWWTGLIELLHGRNNQSISGTDRPAILDGISGIMDRPEWRLSPSPFCPLDQRAKLSVASPAPSQSKTSLASSSSDFLADSVHHNVRNIFVQNLSAQMAFVVDKMSLRNASASLVTFCGKACAYAFMFVPGMAEVLVRLWDLRIDTLRRVLEGSGIGRFEAASGVDDAVCSGFPPALQPLAFSSLGPYMRKLRTPPQLPVGTAHVEWWGHWVERWSGRESDLFYVFVKHFHILVTDFLPADLTRRERVCAPGMLVVHAQILVNLDSTIHRNDCNGKPDPTAGPHAASLDDLLADPDAIASPLPLPPTNATRLMAENRLIMLIRDFLSDRSADHPLARQLFAESFSGLLQICTTGTSLFDHAACYTLLDFLEEALVLLVRFERSRDTPPAFVDFEFWKLVWRRMISSHNTMTEIRLYSFLYTVWNTVVCESGWKADLCHDVLLEPDTFTAGFSHWCPMVRAYFMRLLCWRVARHDGDYSSVDVGIFETLVERLGITWSHYLFLCGLAELEGKPPPLTSPSFPVPSRRLRIVRTDGAGHAGGAFLSFDGLFATKTASRPSSPAFKRSSTLSQVDMELRPGSSLSDLESSETERRGRGLGGFLRNLMPSKSRSKSRSAAARSESRADSSPPPALPPNLLRSATDDLHNHSHSQSRTSSIHSGPSPPSTAKSSSPEPPAQHHRKFSFKFSLEYQHNAKPLPPMRLQPPRLPLPAQHFLLTYSQKANTPSAICAVEPRDGEALARARYCGRALAEWAMVLGECQSFFDRRRSEGVPANRLVETPTLAVEVFRRPG